MIQQIPICDELHDKNTLIITSYRKKKVFHSTVVPCHEWPSIYYYYLQRSHKNAYKSFVKISNNYISIIIFLMLICQEIVQLEGNFSN